MLCVNKKITITFDADGGKTVSAIKIKKGTSTPLPETEKEGFILDGWYLNDIRVTNNTPFDENVTLKAKWISKDAETYTATFDTDGGSKADSIVVECGKELSLPTNPTKSGYTFVSWVDKNGVTVIDKSILLCEDITIKATWKKEETKTTTKTETKAETKAETKVETKAETKVNATAYFSSSGKSATITARDASGSNISQIPVTVSVGRKTSNKVVIYVEPELSLSKGQDSYQNGTKSRVNSSIDVVQWDIVGSINVWSDMLKKEKRYIEFYANNPSHKNSVMVKIEATSNAGQKKALYITFPAATQDVY